MDFGAHKSQPSGRPDLRESRRRDVSLSRVHLACHGASDDPPVIDVTTSTYLIMQWFGWPRVNVLKRMKRAQNNHKQARDDFCVLDNCRNMLFAPQPTSDVTRCFVSSCRGCVAHVHRVTWDPYAPHAVSWLMILEGCDANLHLTLL